MTEIAKLIKVSRFSEKAGYFLQSLHDLHPNNLLRESIAEGYAERIPVPPRPAPREPASPLADEAIRDLGATCCYRTRQSRDLSP
jgi:hypothetical protein